MRYDFDAANVFVILVEKIKLMVAQFLALC